MGRVNVVNAPPTLGGGDGLGIENVYERMLMLIELIAKVQTVDAVGQLVSSGFVGENISILPNPILQYKGNQSISWNSHKQRQHQPAVLDFLWKSYPPDNSFYWWIAPYQPSKCIYHEISWPCHIWKC